MYKLNLNQEQLFVSDSFKINKDFYSYLLLFLPLSGLGVYAFEIKPTSGCHVMGA